MSVLLVFVGGALGAPTRYLLDRLVQRRYGRAFPLGTLTVNVAGSFALGALAAGLSHRGLPAPVGLAAGTGFCGGLTTFSTFGYETVRLAEDGSVRAAVANVLVSLLTGCLAALAGYALVLAV